MFDMALMCMLFSFISTFSSMKNNLCSCIQSIIRPHALLDYYVCCTAELPLTTAAKNLNGICQYVHNEFCIYAPAHATFCWFLQFFHFFYL